MGKKGPVGKVPVQDLVVVWVKVFNVLLLSLQPTLVYVEYFFLPVSQFE